MNAEVIQLPAWQAHDSGLKIRNMPKNASTAEDSSTTCLRESDESLMQRVGVGEDAALAVLIDRWKKPLVNFFYRSLQSLEQSEDLAQMVYIRLHRAAPKYRPTAKFSTFMFHIARRLLINEYRRQQRKPLEMVDPNTLMMKESSSGDFRIMEIEEAFSQALVGLPENQRTAILLLKQQELSYKEIAETMESTESAVKTWIFRARKHLKTALGELLKM